MSERILVEIRGTVAAITLNRPEKRNAIDGLLIQELKDAFASTRANDELRVITLTGAGKDFCSGADLAGLEKVRNAGVMANMEDARAMAELFIAMRRHPKLIVALVKGRALAGGCGLATACDLVLAEESASFGYPEINIGFVPAMVMAILRRSVSEKRALELITSGAPVTAAQAKEFGMINQIYPNNDFDVQAAAYVENLASRSGSASTLCKNLLYHMDQMSFETAIEAGVHVNGIARLTEDCQTGIDKFLKRR
ncbi:MAG TPA: enoyl-CoA hydratase/isomerase family protein [Bryobacteraceae bacterium]|jgi:methylglutaconyl-CoA hydratase